MGRWLPQARNVLVPRYGTVSGFGGNLRSRYWGHRVSEPWALWGRYQVCASALAMDQLPLQLVTTRHPCAAAATWAHRRSCGQSARAPARLQAGAACAAS